MVVVDCIFISSPDFDQSHPSLSQKVRYLKFIGDFKELVARLTVRTGRGIAMGCETVVQEFYAMYNGLNSEAE